MCRRSSTRSAVPVLEWREAARADLLSIVDYLSDDNPDAAQRLKDDIEAKAAEPPDHTRMGRSADRRLPLLAGRQRPSATFSALNCLPQSSRSPGRFATSSRWAGAGAGRVANRRPV